MPMPNVVPLTGMGTVKNKTQQIVHVKLQFKTQSDKQVAMVRKLTILIDYTSICGEVELMTNNLCLFLAPRSVVTNSGELVVNTNLHPSIVWGISSFKTKFTVYARETSSYRLS